MEALRGGRQLTESRRLWREKKQQIKQLFSKNLLTNVTRYVAIYTKKSFSGELCLFFKSLGHLTRDFGASLGKRKAAPCGTARVNIINIYFWEAAIYECRGQRVTVSPVSLVLTNAPRSFITSRVSSGLKERVPSLKNLTMSESK